MRLHAYSFILVFGIILSRGRCFALSQFGSERLFSRFNINNNGNNQPRLGRRREVRTTSSSSSSSQQNNERIDDPIIYHSFVNIGSIADDEEILIRRNHRLRKIRHIRRVAAPLLLLLLVMLTSPRPARAILEVQQRGGGGGGVAAASLGVKNLITAALMLIGLAGVPLTLIGLPSLSKDLLTSASRCAVQVLFLGCVLLQKIMMGTSSQPLFVLAWIVGVGLLAGKEAVSRTQYTYPSMKRHVYTSILFGGMSVLGLAMIFNVLGDTIIPWYQPRVWIPVAGMLFGNTLSACALATSTITKNFATKQSQVELFLARGATSHEATLPLISDALLTALTPTINGLAVTGIVHIPGMMTGQILAGQSASQAAIYQIMINLLIATTACTSVQLILRYAIRSLVDSHNHRLYSNKLKLLSSSLESSSSSNDDHRWFGLAKLLPWKSNETLLMEQRKDLTEEHASSQETKIATARPLSISDSGTAEVDDNNKYNNQESVVILEANGLFVPRANAKVTFQCKSHDRIGISGISGVGKSQILRTIAQLEEWKEGALLFQGESVDSNIRSTPKYRSRVVLVPQDTTVLEGTPYMFYEQVLKFDNQKRSKQQHKASSSSFDHHRLYDILKKFGLETSIVHRQWPTLSGGEAQRTSLAIALCLSPDILLLDESLSALDESTSKQVERVLIDTGLPIIIVTHSRDQLQRFCTHQMEL